MPRSDVERCRPELRSIKIGPLLAKKYWCIAFAILVKTINISDSNFGEISGRKERNFPATLAG